MKKPVKVQAPKEPVMHLCNCGAWGSYGLGLPAQYPPKWWCRECLPETFWQEKQHDPR